MKVGAWKNFEELEESISLQELDLMLRTISEDRKHEQIFLAGLKGIDLSDSFSDSLEDKRKEIERRAAERLGKGRQHEANEFADIGIELVTD